MKNKNETCKNCDDCKKHQEHAFELEVDEDLQQERLQRFWKKYHLLVYILVVAILLITAGSQFYQTWRLKIREQESDTFEGAVLKIFEQKPDEARPVLQELALNARTGYRYLARLELAGLAARQSNLEQALSELKILMDSDAPETIKAVATLSYVGYQVDTGNVQELLSLLKPYESNPAFADTAAGLAMLLYLRDNDPAKAKEALKKALLLPGLSSAAQTKLTALSQMIENN